MAWEIFLRLMELRILSVKMAAVIGSVFLVREATVSNRIGHLTPSWVSR